MYIYKIFNSDYFCHLGPPSGFVACSDLFKQGILNLESQIVNTLKVELSAVLSKLDGKLTTIDQRFITIDQRLTAMD